MCANDIDVPIGKIVYTQMLNDSGGVESDATVTRLVDDVFCFITGAAQAVRDMAWMKRLLPDNARCVITDISVGEACIGVMGPKARTLLRLLSPTALENDAFPFGECQQIEIGMATARAHRISYVGELGWSCICRLMLLGMSWKPFSPPMKTFVCAACTQWIRVAWKKVFVTMAMT